MPITYNWELRHRAHQAFDQFWKRRLMSRDSAYDMLATWLGLSHDDAHFAKFTDAQSQQVLDLVGNLSIPTKGDRGHPTGHNKRDLRLNRVAKTHTMQGIRERDVQEQIANAYAGIDDDGDDA